MSRPLLSLIFLATMLPLQADTLGDLKTRLRALDGAEPIKAQVEHRTWNRNGDAKKPVITQGSATALAEEGPQGLRLQWSREQLQQALKETRARAADPEKTTPTRDAMTTLDAVSLQDYFSAGPKLLLELEQAKLVEERADALDGQPVRLLSFKVEPRLSADQKKYVKELEATARLWLGSDGLPLRAEQHLKVRGRAMMVISFQSEEHDDYRFTRVGNRLVTLRHEHEGSGSGGGENGQSKRITTLTLR